MTIAAFQPNSRRLMARIGRQLKSLSMLALIGCVVATVAAYTAKAHWLLDLFSNFHMQYVAVLAVLALVHAWQRQYVALVVAVIVAGLNVAPIADLLAHSAHTQRSETTQAWVLLSANLSKHNDNVGAVLQELAAIQADVVVLQEYTLRWADDLAELQTLYPHHINWPSEGAFGIALYSRWPLVSAEVIALGGSTPAIVAELASTYGPLKIIAVHLRPPTSADSAALRARQFTQLTELAANSEMPLAVAGDFNATPWSPDFRSWTNAAQLRNGLDGHGLTYTWPANLPIFWIPIDACVVNSRLEVVAQRRGNRIGSDHYPLVTTLTMTSND